MNQIKEYDLVAIDQNISAIHKETKQPILLRKGQVGTVIMDYDGKAFLIDFADEKGITYAMETVLVKNLIHLLYTPVALQAS